jgi:OmpA-OmpF porin, OOP family
MKKFITGILLFVPLLISSQNLVINPSFEDTCRYPFWPGNWLFAEHWYSPNNESPNYFSIYNISQLYVPNNNCGFQLANNGNAYCGFYTYNSATINDREYLQSRLLDSLINNKRYIVSFYVSLADNALYSVSNIGAYISEDSINSTGCCVLLYTPQVYNDTTLQLPDKNIWYKITGSFISNGREKYITIGNFIDDAHTDTMYVGGTSGWQASYYYLDDVSVELDTTQGVEEVAVNKAEFNIFPNPAKDDVTFEYTLDEGKDGVLILYNLMGEKMASYILPAEQNSVDFSTISMPDGVFVYKVAVDNNTIYTGKLIILK